GAIITAAAEAVRPAATSGGVTLEVVLDTPGASVMGDGVRLQQVVWNLLSNGVKFTERAGRVSARLARHGTHARIQVTDTGRGIAAAGTRRPQRAPGGRRSRQSRSADDDPREVWRPTGRRRIDGGGAGGARSRAVRRDGGGHRHARAGRL